ncbi:MAG: FAD-dependent oxidoreductase [Ignavibacteriae bacterium]|nr:FAD-dependent oxidoreductase [Ignavibacteriota bacterium]
MDFKKTKIEFTGRKEICENTYSFTFIPESYDYDFKPGQYAHFTIDEPKYNDDSGNSRPLSIASSPHHKNLILVAARDNGSVFIQNLLSLEAGSEVFISEPEGDITLHNDEKIENVFIAGGIGITPVRSIVEYATESSLRNKITLFYLNRSRKQTAFLQDLQNWSDMNDNFRLIQFFDDAENEKSGSNIEIESGRIDAERLKKYLGDFNNKIYNVIGPPEMVNSVKEILIKENVPEEYIRAEKFS